MVIHNLSVFHHTKSADVKRGDNKSLVGEVVKQIKTVPS